MTKINWISFTQVRCVTHLFFCVSLKIQRSRTLQSPFSSPFLRFFAALPVLLASLVESSRGRSLFVSLAAKTLACPQTFFLVKHLEIESYRKLLMHSLPPS